MEGAGSDAAGSPRHPRGRALLVVFVLGITAGAFALSSCGDDAAQHVEVPSPAGLTDAEPEVRDLITAIQRDLSQQTGNAFEWARLAEAYDANGFLESARSCYEEAVSRKADRAKWWYRLALVRSMLGDRAGALRDMQRAAELEPGRAAVHWRRGLWLFDAGELETATAAFERARECNPAARPALLGLCQVHLAAGRTVEAAAALETHLVQVPRDAYARFLLGTAYRDLGRLEDAKIELARGSGAKPAWRDAWQAELLRFRVGYAATMMDAGEFAAAGADAAAVRLLERLRRDHPDDVPLLNNLALSYLALRRHAEALAVLERALGLAPDEFETHRNLASACASAGYTGRAAEFAESAIALRPDSGQAYLARAALHTGAGRLVEAEKDLEAALSRDPTLTAARLQLGLVHCERGEYARGLEQLEQARREDPASAPALIGVGRALIELGRLEEAEAALALARRVEPGHRALGPAERRLVERRASEESPR